MDGRYDGVLVSKTLLLSPIYVKREQTNVEPAAARNREQCTQTSKTIIELARREERRLEPYGDCAARNRLRTDEGRPDDGRDRPADKADFFFGNNPPSRAAHPPSYRQFDAMATEAPNVPIVVNVMSSKPKTQQGFKSQSFVEPSSVKRRDAKRLNGNRVHFPKLQEMADDGDGRAVRRSSSFTPPPAAGEGVNYLIDMPRYDETAGRNDCSMSTLFFSAEGGLCSIMAHVKSSDWGVALKGLGEIVDLAIICDVELLMPVMSGVNHKLLELLKSPRSHVCRSACQLAGQLFETVKDTRRPEFDDIVYVLLTKTADANKFIRHDANVALDSMITHVPIFHSVRSVCSKGPTHRNPLVRCAAVRLLICAVVMAGPDTVLNTAANESTRRRIVVHLATFLEDKNLETRKYAERLYKILEKQGNLEFFLKKYLEREKFDLISRVLKPNRMGKVAH